MILLLQIEHQVVQHCNMKTKLKVKDLWLLTGKLNLTTMALRLCQTLLCNLFPLPFLECSILKISQKEH